MRAARAVRSVAARLEDAGIESSEAEARALVTHAAQTTRSLVLIDALPPGFDAALEESVQRREMREPLQLILGYAPFRRISLEVRAGVFIPRPETEVGIDAVHGWWAGRGTPSASFTALDLCCGSGTLAAGLVDEFPTAIVHACDINPDAVGLARTNLARLDPSARAHVAHAGVPLDAAEHSGEWLLAAIGADPEKFRAGAIDLVISNPPYIPAGAIPRQVEVLDYDPHESLYGGGEDGTATPSAVIAFAARVLADGGLLVMEHADVQGARMRSLAAQTGAFDHIATQPDLTGKDRFLLAVRGSRESRMKK